MADFCQQCSTEMFGLDTKDLALFLNDPRRGTLKPGYGWPSLCEGCGPIITDDEGRCQGLCMKLEHGGIPNRPTKIWMPHPTNMRRGARFVWHGQHYLVVNRCEGSLRLILAPWNLLNRARLVLSWWIGGAWQDTEPHPCDSCPDDLRVHRVNGLCRKCNCPGFRERVTTTT